LQLAQQGIDENRARRARLPATLAGIELPAVSSTQRTASAFVRDPFQLVDRSQILTEALTSAI
jgi:hypothetical protein